MVIAVLDIRHGEEIGASTRDLDIVGHTDDALCERIPPIVHADRAGGCGWRPMRTAGSDREGQLAATYSCQSMGCANLGQSSSESLEKTRGAVEVSEISALSTIPYGDAACSNGVHDIQSIHSIEHPLVQSEKGVG